MTRDETIWIFRKQVREDSESSANMMPNPKRTHFGLIFKELRDR